MPIDQVKAHKRELAAKAEEVSNKHMAGPAYNK
jgi:hypothetical protein